METALRIGYYHCTATGAHHTPKNATTADQTHGSGSPVKTVKSGARRYFGNWQGNRGGVHARRDGSPAGGASQSNAG
jgi:hypothetical protein